MAAKEPLANGEYKAAVLRILADQLIALESIEQTMLISVRRLDLLVTIAERQEQPVWGLRSKSAVN